MSAGFDPEYPLRLGPASNLRHGDVVNQAPLRHQPEPGQDREGRDERRPTDPCGGRASEAANWHCYAYNCPSTRLAEFQNVTWTAQVGYALYSIIVGRTCEHTSIVH